VSIRNAAGAIQSQATVMALMTDVTPTENKVYRYDGTSVLYRGRAFDGAATFESGKDVRFVPGQLYRKTDLDAEWPTATFTSITSATGAYPTAGGVVATIKGTNLGGVTSVTFGGTAGTNLTVVDPQTVLVTIPAKTAGSVAVVIVDDATASASLSGGSVTYA
jgi:hypothetical protein